MIIGIDAVGICIGGGATILCELVPGLIAARPDWTIHLFVLPRADREFDDPQASPRLHVHYIRGASTFVGRMRWVNFRLPGIASELGFDGVFAFANIGNLRLETKQVIYCQQALAVGKVALKKRSVLGDLRITILHRLIRRSARASKAVVVQTETMRRSLIQSLPLLESRIKVIPAGVRTVDEHSPLRPEVVELLNRASRPRILFISTLYPHKNHAKLIEAMARLRDHHPTATLLLTIPAARELKALAKQFGIQGSVYFVGSLSSREIDYALKNSDVMAYPSVAESFGLPVVEALAVGCPVAVSDLPYAHETASDAGTYFDPMDAVSIAHALD